VINNGTSTAPLTGGAGLLARERLVFELKRFERRDGLSPPQLKEAAAD